MFHSISHEAQDPALTATDLLAYDLEQLVRHLKRNRDDDGGFDTSGLVGVERLSMRRLRAHGAQLEKATLSQPLKISEPPTRVTSVADEQDGSQSLDRGLLLSPAESFNSTRSTPPPIAIQPKDLEALSYHELIEDGGRPVYSIRHLPHLADPTVSYEALLP
ncbi:MAG: hypothetical protein Q9185_005781 [Variospora sp. 1 TL-2023]